METYYKKQQRPGGIRAYEDYREMLEKETDIQGVVNITPDHQHGSINIAALRKGKAAISHKPVASVLYEVRRTLQAARDSSAVSHLLAYSNSADQAYAGRVDQFGRDRHRARSAQLDRPAVLAAGHAGRITRRVRRCPTASTGRCGRDPSPTGLTIRATPMRSIEAGMPMAPVVWETWGTTAYGSRTGSSNLGVPEWVEGRPNNEAWVNDKNVSTGGRVSTVGLPRSSTVRWRHPATAARPAVDTFWYDGGMKPQTPEELYADSEDLGAEGMLIIGDKGKILCDFRGNAPRLLPRSRQQAFAGSVAVPEFDATSTEDEWVNAIKTGKKSKGSFEEVAPLAEAVTLANIALRVPYKRLLWDAQRMEFTNAPEANAFVRREQYRDGLGHANWLSRS